MYESKVIGIELVIREKAMKKKVKRKSLEGDAAVFAKETRKDQSELKKTAAKYAVGTPVICEILVKVDEPQQPIEAVPSSEPKPIVTSTVQASPTDLVKKPETTESPVQGPEPLEPTVVQSNPMIPSGFKVELLPGVISRFRSADYTSTRTGMCCQSE